MLLVTSEAFELVNVFQEMTNTLTLLTRKGGNVVYVDDFVFRK